MSRCFLCGGVLADGRCTECGLDNRKNDKKYQLNVHNEGGAHFHDGSCEQQVNKSGRKIQDVLLQDTLLQSTINKRKKTSKAEDTFDYQKMLDEQVKKRSNKTGRKTGARGIVFYILVVALVILFYLISFFMDDSYAEEGSYLLSQLQGVFSRTTKQDGMAAFRTQNQEAITYDPSSDRYFEQKLQNGMYEVGYELPPGVCQFECGKAGNAVASAGTILWVNKKKDNYGASLTLYSSEAQKSYAKSLKKKAVYGERSGEITLHSGDILFVEDFEKEALSVRGMMEDASFVPKKRPSQELGEVVEPGRSMIAGKDFDAGVYNVSLNPYADTWFGRLTMQLEDGALTGLYGDSLTLLLTEADMIYYRVPIEKGTRITMDEGEEGTILLTPSF